MTDATIAEALFYAAQAAYAYRGGPIYVWDHAAPSEQTGYVALAQAMQALPEATDEEMAQAIIAPLGAVLAGGIDLGWSEMSGAQRFELLLVVEAFRRAAA